MKCLKINRIRKIYIVLTVFVSLSSCMFADDILDSYIGELLTKSESNKDELLSVLDESRGKAVKSIQKSDTKKTPAVKQADPNDVTKVVSKESVKKGATPVKKEAVETKRSGSAILSKTKDLREKLKDTSISSLPEGGNPTINSQLQDVLAQLKSLRFSEEGKNQEQQSEVSLKPEEAAEKPPVKADPANNEENVESKSLTEEKQMAVVIPEDTSDVVDGFELAESLFHIGDKASALKYYRKALDMTLPVGKTANPKRAWILFQTGNCLYGVDNMEAIKIFDQLIQEHPNSDWTNCARTKKQVLKWLMVEKPMTLAAGKLK